MTKIIGILGFDDVEALDFAGPYEVFTTAERVCIREDSGNQFKVVSISNQNVFTARAGLSINAQFSLKGAPELDVLIVPGGITTQAEKDSELIDWLSNVGPNVEVLASVCTGVFILASANLIGNRKVTTHWEDISDLRAKFPNLKVTEGVRWVDNGQLITSAGISAGIDMSLHLVSKFGGRELALLTAKQMDYRWQESQD
jgi:transcriptional regulator GlxA family with amidase domain